MLKLKQLETTAKITNCETWIVFLQFSIFTNKEKLKVPKTFSKKISKHHIWFLAGVFIFR